MTICKRTRPNERGTAMEPYPHHPQRHVFVARTSEGTWPTGSAVHRHGPQCYACVLESMESWEVPLSRVDGDTITIDDKARRRHSWRIEVGAQRAMDNHYDAIESVGGLRDRGAADRARSVLHLTDNGRSWQRQFIDAYMRRYSDTAGASFARRRHIVDGLIGHTLAEPFTTITNCVVRQGSVAEILGLLGESWFSEDETGVYVLMPTARRGRAMIEVTRIASREEFEKTRGGTAMEVMSEIIGGIGQRMVWQQAQMSSPLIGWGREGFGPSGVLPEEGYTPPPTRQMRPLTIARNTHALPAAWTGPDVEVRVLGMLPDGTQTSERVNPDGTTASAFARIDGFEVTRPVNTNQVINVGIGDPAGFIEGQEYELPMIGGVDLATGEGRGVVHTMRVTKVTPAGTEDDE